MPLRLGGVRQQLGWQGVQPARRLPNLDPTAAFALAAVRHVQSLPHARQRHVQQAQFAVERIVILQRVVVRDETFFGAGQKYRSPLPSLAIGECCTAAWLRAAQPGRPPRPWPAHPTIRPD